MTILVNSDPYSSVFVILASIASAAAAIVAFVCCCRGSTSTDRRSKKRKTSEEREEAVGDVIASAIAAADTAERKALALSDQQQSQFGAGEESSSSLRSSAGYGGQQLDGNANRSLANNDLAALTCDNQTSASAATDSNDNRSEDGISDQEQTPRDYSTIRKAGVNVKRAMAAYETGQLSQSAPTEKSVLRTPRKKLDAALKDQIIIKAGRPPIQRHTVDADAFNTIEEQSGMVAEADAEEELRKQEVKRILPDLLVATPRRTSDKSRLRPEDALTNNEMSSTAEGDRKSSGSRISEAESDYFGAVQRQDAVLRSVEKARAPHKHKKGKVPTTYIEDSADMKRSRPHSSGDILDSVSER